MTISLEFSSEMSQGTCIVDTLDFVGVKWLRIEPSLSVAMMGSRRRM